MTIPPKAEEALPPIERDEAMDRTYIPIPGGWEIQTKGKGSSFRICDTKTGKRWIVTEERMHKTLEQMARDIRAALAIPSVKQSLTTAAFVALAEQCGAEVGRHEGEVVWIKFHQPSIAPFAAAALAPKADTPEAGAIALDDPLSDAALTIIAACREAFPPPPPGSPVEDAWMQAIAYPESVPDYLRAIAAHQLKDSPDELDAARWRWLPAFFEEYQINAMKLYRDIDEMIAAHGGKDAGKGGEK